VKFHSDIIMRCEEAPYWVDFTKYVFNVLEDEDRTARFLASIEFPVRTLVTTNRIQDLQKKVFESQDGYIEIHANDIDTAKELSAYLDEIKEPEFWEEEGFTARYSDVNKILVVDINEQGKPIFYTVNWENVLDAEYADRSNYKFKHIHYEAGKDRSIFIDDQAYYVVVVEKGESRIESINPHGLGECPAGFLVSTPLNERLNPFARYSPLSPVLGSLDRLLFAHTAKNGYELIAAMPPWWMYELDVECSNPQCQDGRVEFEEGKWAECVTCGGKRRDAKKLKIGSLLTLPPPVDNTDADLRNPIGKVDADAGSLDFNMLNVKRMEDEIINSVTGVTSSIVAQEAINEKQVKAQLESERGALLFLAKDITNTRKWLIDTICKLHKPSEYKGCTINMGTDFFLLSEMQEIQEYAQLRQTGVSSYLMEIKQRRLFQRVTKGKPTLHTRSLILESLEPISQYSLTECGQLMQMGAIDPIDFVVKVNFVDFIRQFEREYGSIEQYMINSDFQSKIDSIKTIIYNYGKDKQAPRRITEQLSANRPEETDGQRPTGDDGLSV
jgi:hypothetical protein